MDKVMENVSDRELFSELVDNPINPLHWQNFIVSSIMND